MKVVGMEAGEVIPPSCAPGVAAACGGWGGRSSTCGVLSEAPWTLSRVKGVGSSLGEVGSGEGNFSFLLFVLCL